MPSFVKNPKFISGALVALWLSYVVYGNSAPNPVEIKILPFGVSLQMRLSAILAASFLLGSVLTLIIQHLWRKRQASKRASRSAADSGASNSTAA